MKNRKIRRSNIITIAACAALLSVGTYHTGKAASQAEYKSQGKIVFDNNTADTSDDVIFDASDFRIINDMVVSGKNQIRTELNKYPSINLDLSIIPDFNELAEAIDTLTDDATAEDKMILKDYTAYVNGDKLTGSMENNSDATVDAAYVVMDATYTYFSVPADGYYNVNSKIKALNTDFMESVKQAEYDKGYRDGLKDNSNSNIAAVVDPNNIHVYNGNGNQQITVPTKSAVYAIITAGSWENANAGDGNDNHITVYIDVGGGRVKSAYEEAWKGDYNNGGYDTHGPSVGTSWNGAVNAGTVIKTGYSANGYYNTDKSAKSSQIIVVGLK